MTWGGGSEIPQIETNTSVQSYRRESTVRPLRLETPDHKTARNTILYLANMFIISTWESALIHLPNGTWVMFGGDNVKLSPPNTIHPHSRAYLTQNPQSNLWQSLEILTIQTKQTPIKPAQGL